MTIPGLSLFYAGLVRVKNVLSVMMQCFALTCLMSVVWFVVGYTIAFGSEGVEQGPYIGDFGNIFFSAITIDSMSGTIPTTLFAVFQMTFAIITPALIVGAFAERMRFSAMLIFQHYLASVRLLAGLSLGLGWWLARCNGTAGLRRRHRGAYYCSGSGAGGGTNDGATQRLWYRCHAATQSRNDCRWRWYALGRLVWF